ADVPQVAVVVRPSVRGRDGIAVERRWRELVSVQQQRLVRLVRTEILSVADVNLQVRRARRVVDSGQRRMPAGAIERGGNVGIVSGEQVDVAPARDGVAVGKDGG